MVLCHAVRIMLVLLGEQGSRRTEYFTRAAEELGEMLVFCPWKDYEKMTEFKRAVVKVDPPSYDGFAIAEMKGFLEEYLKRLDYLGQRGRERDWTFLNPPSGLQRLLNKAECKKILEREGIRHTRQLSDSVNDTDMLFALMEEKKCPMVFLKPKLFSGAAGIVALSWNPRLGKMKAYSSSLLEGEELMHTKRLHFLEDKKDILALLRKTLQLDVIVERWYPKAGYGRYKYDLRLLWQFGKTDAIVVRTSEGPITNLHLNNRAIAFGELGLPKSSRDAIEDLCGQAMRAFPEMNMAGIDMMLDARSLNPRIIEMNGQGDLLHQDIFSENKVYKRQIKHLRRIEDG